MKVSSLTIALLISGFCAQASSNNLWPACETIDKTVVDSRQGDSVAQLNLGKCYLIGKGVEQNFGLYAQWVMKSAEQGYAPAQYEAGKVYEYGRGAEQDPVKSFLWYKRAADQNFLFAIPEVSLRYSQGNGVTKDFSKAAEWTKRGAELGSPGDQKLLGLFYETGKGVNKDLEKARYWYKKAANQQEDLSEARSAQRYLDALNKQNNPFELSCANYVQEYSAVRPQHAGTQAECFQQQEGRLKVYYAT